MRITMSFTYLDHNCLVLDDCERFYCSTHRFLYRQCESAQYGYEGDRDVVNGIRQIVETTNECPKCMAEARDRRERRETEACKECNPT